VLIILASVRAGSQTVANLGLGRSTTRRNSTVGPKRVCQMDKSEAYCSRICNERRSNGSRHAHAAPIVDLLRVGNAGYTSLRGINIPTYTKQSQMLSWLTLRLENEDTSLLNESRYEFDQLCVKSSSKAY
jgi:hypothetical protein